MEILNFIIHNVKKKQFEQLDLKNVHKRKSEIDISSNDNSFLEKVLEVYYKKSNPYYGVFDENVEYYPYQSHLAKLISNDYNFLSFSYKVFDDYVKVLQTQTQATGGFFLVIRYVYRNSEYLAIILLNNTATFDIDEENLEVIPKPRLDIDKIDVANVVDLAKWQDNEDKYLTFSKGRKDLSEYFIKFIGCTIYTNAMKLNDNLRLGLNSFIDKSNLSNEEAQKLKMTAFAFFQERSSKKEEIKLDQLANHLFPDKPQDFTGFLHDENIEISASFKCELRAYKSFKFITYQSKDMMFRFAKSLVTQGVVQVDKANSQITIKVKESVIDQFND
jgi:nucleoid-associated protein YejK